MEALFLELLNRSIAAGWTILGVLFLRALLRNGPKAMRCVLWALVGIRLICPVSVESALSLIPSAIPGDILLEEEPAVESGFGLVDNAVNPAIRESFAPNRAESANPIQVAAFLASLLWAAGMAAMLLYAVVSCLRLRRQVAASICHGGNVWLSDSVRMPFIFGIFRPRIYLPSDLEEGQLDSVMAHEKAHLKRRDHWWKPLGFLLLSVYWFQPLCWAAYIFLCRDMELACDEQAVKGMGDRERKRYAEALLSCSVPRSWVSACPLAFGEVGIKERVKGVLHYRKPALWIVLAAAIACAGAAVCFLTDPVSEGCGEMLGARYSVKEVLYDAPWYDAGYTSDSAPEYLFTADACLLQRSQGGVLGTNGTWNMVGVFHEADGIGDRLPGLLLSEGATEEGPLSERERKVRELLGRVERIWRVDTDGETGLSYLIMQAGDGRTLLAAGYGLDGNGHIRWIWEMERHEAQGDMAYFAALISSMCGEDVQVFSLYESEDMPDRLIAGFHAGGNRRGFAVFSRNQSDGWRIKGYSYPEGGSIGCVTLGEDWGFGHSVTVVLSSREDLAYVAAWTDGAVQQETVSATSPPSMCVFEWQELLSGEEAVEVRFYDEEDKELETVGN